jgi:hypothetical protein
MPTKQVLLAITVLISVCIGSSMAWSNLARSAGAPASETRIDFDQVFANVAQRGKFERSIAQRLPEEGWNFTITATVRGSPDDGSINRQRKGDRLPGFRSVLLEPVFLPHCEPVAAPFADPVLGRIVGRCLV